MLSRREMLAGAAACSLPLLFRSQTQPPPADAIDIITDRVRRSIQSFADQSEMQIPGAWRKLAYRWSNVRDLRTAVEQEIPKLYEDLTRPAMWSGERLSLEAQLRIERHFPIDYYLMDKEFFQALIDCVPTHLR